MLGDLALKMEVAAGVEARKVGSCAYRRSVSAGLQTELNLPEIWRRLDGWKAVIRWANASVALLEDSI